MSVTARIKLPVDFIISNPDKEYSEMDITTKRLIATEVIVDAPNATLGTAISQNLSGPSDGMLEADIPNLSASAYYQIEAEITNPNNTKKSRKMYINTADNTVKYYFSRQIIVSDENTQTESPWVNGQVRLIRATGEWDLWIEGLKTEGGEAIPEPETAAERYNHITNKQSDGYVLRTTNRNGEFFFEGLIDGNYNLEYLGSGGWTNLESNIVINAFMSSGFYTIQS